MGNLNSITPQPSRHTMRWCCCRRRPLQLRTTRRYGTATTTEVHDTSTQAIAMRPLCTCCCLVSNRIVIMWPLRLCECLRCCHAHLAEKAWHCDSTLVFGFQAKIEKKKRHHSSFHVGMRYSDVAISCETCTGNTLSVEIHVS